MLVSCVHPVAILSAVSISSFAISASTIINNVLGLSTGLLPSTL